MKNKIYPCELCDCYDHDNYWMCPVLKKQICDVCCLYDVDAGDVKFKGKQMRYWCKKEKCKHLD